MPRQPYGSRSEGPYKELSIRRPSVLVEAPPQKIRDGVAQESFSCANVLRNCILRVSDIL